MFRIRKICIGLVFLIIILTLGQTPRVEAQEQNQQKVARQDTTTRKRSIKLFLKQIEVQGWIDRPQMVYVVPGINPEVDDILLDRSFLDEILRPLDKDKFEQQKLVRKKIVIPW